MNTITWQKIEGGIVFVLAISAAVILRDMPWWAFILMAFAPDLAMVGYAAGPRSGATIYNIAHIYAFGGLVILAAVVSASDFWVCAGLLFIAHAGIDRALGFGLKEESCFKHTHLGVLK